MGIVTKKELISFCERQVDRLHNSPLSRSFRKKHPEVKLHFNFSPKLMKSTGGIMLLQQKYEPHIFLSLNYYYKAFNTPVEDRNKFTYKEYRRLMNNPVIGDYIGPWQGVISSLIVHEYAHCLTYFIRNKWLQKNNSKDKRIYNYYMKPHGKGWQSQYRQLRIEHVNNIIDWSSY